MPKRSAHDKLEHYKRKIRKLEEREKKRNARRTNSLPEEEPITEPINGDTECVEPQPAMTDINSDEGQQPLLLMSFPILEEVVQTDVAHTMDATPAEAPALAESITPELDPELLSALGASTSDAPDFGDPIHESLANLWLPLLKKGLTKEEKSSLMKEHLIPSNCTLLQAPKLNAEISAAVAEVVRGRDKKIEGFQRVLGAGTSAINRAMDLLLKTDDKVTSLKLLSNGCRLLADLHYAFTNDRRKLITPSLEKNFLHMIQDTERDDTLFGNSLAEKIKASKAIERQGLQIRKASNTKVATPSPQMSAVRPTHQGNWSGPPRYPSTRGGRGGQRRPAPIARRPYQVPSTASQTSSKSYSQTKTRANMHH